MAYGKNQIVLTGEPKNTFWGCVISGTPKPGTVMEITSATLKGGKPTMQASTTRADGVSRLMAVLIEDKLQGRLPTDAYVSGAWGEVYCPVGGDTCNMIVNNLAGTADDHAIGELLMVDNSNGGLIAATGTPAQTWTLLETITDPSADTLAACMYNG